MIFDNLNRSIGVSISSIPVYPDGRGLMVPILFEDICNSSFTPIQTNYSMSMGGVLRGLHTQIGHEQTKVLVVLEGEIDDWFVDLRPENLGLAGVARLSAYGENVVVIPPYCAHGFETITATRLLYFVDKPRVAEAEVTINFFDPALNLELIAKNHVMSDKDRLQSISLEDYSKLISK